VVNALLAEGTFIPRAISRDDNSEASQKLKSRGVQIVKADPTDTESLQEAIRGSEAVFLVTVPFVAQSEQDQAQRIIDASKAVRVQFIVFSSLPNVTKDTNGKFTKVTWFDSKSEIEDSIKASGIPHSFIYLGYFMENAWKLGFLKPNATDPSQLDFTVVRAGPKSIQPFTWGEKDTGEAVLALLKNYRERPEKVLNSKFYAISERLEMGEFVNALNQVLEKKVNYLHVETTGQEGMDQVFDYTNSYGYYPSVTTPDPNLVDLGAKFGTVKEFIRTNKERLLRVANSTQGH
jgi:nucleoside-diphosphate-sugar epimerase